MTKDNEQRRLEEKLELWNTTGFSQFLQDLDDYIGGQCHVAESAASMKKIYRARLSKMQEDADNFKQGKLDL